MNIFLSILRRSLAILCFLLILASGKSQGLSVEFPATGGVCVDVAHDTNGDYLMVGAFSGGQVQKVSPSGAVIWSNANTFLGGRGVSIAATADGGSIALGESYVVSGVAQNLAVKLTATGVKEWQTAIPNTNLPNGLKRMLPTADGGYLAAGETRDQDLKVRTWLVKLDATGAISWTNSFSFNAFSQTVTTMTALSDGNFAILGSVADASAQRDLALAKITASGTVLWQKTYPKPAYQVACDLKETPDGSLVVMAADKQTDPNHLALLKVAANGDELWFNLLGLPQSTGNYMPDWYQSMAVDAAGYLYVPMNSYQTDILVPSQLLLLKINPAGGMEDFFQLDPEQYAYRIITSPNNMLSIVGGDSDTKSFLVRVDGEGQTTFDLIEGSVFRDGNQNCLPDGSDYSLAGYIVEAKPATGPSAYTVTRPDGTYTLRTLQAGTFTVLVHPPAQYYMSDVPCTTTPVTFTQIGQSATLPPIGVYAPVSGPFMTIQGSSGLLRNCMPATYQLVVCNEGNEIALNPTLTFTADPNLTFLHSSQPANGLPNNTFLFNLPNIGPGQCHNLSVTFQVACGLPLGTEICTQMHVTPDDLILSPDPNWDESDIRVSGACVNNQPVFTITNVGAGSMTEASDYVIIEDNIMYLGQFQLDALEDTVITLPGTGHNFYLRAAQPDGHPSLEDPSAAITGCAGGTGQPLATELNISDGTPFSLSICDVVVGSYDPNDKRGFPLGWKAERLIEPGQELRYVIRFQNTGTDTAFTVVIKDQLPATLDVATLKPGAGSHPFTWNLSADGLLTLRFSNIMLPDSNVNEPGSHGFVSFSITPKADLPLGTVVENTAAIYFDFNEPVVTEPSHHQIGTPLLTAVTQPHADALDVRISPNPFDQTVTFTLPGDNSAQLLHFTLYDLTGKTIHSAYTTGNAFTFRREDLPAGMYCFRLEDASGRYVAGKIQAQ